MKIKKILFCASIILLVPAAVLALNWDTLGEKIVFEPDISTTGFILSADYDYGRVNINERHGLWRQWTNRLTWRNALIGPYIEINDYDRFQLKDRTAEIGSYFVLPNHDYIDADIGLGLKHQYIYNRQFRLEYAHLLKNYLFWESGYQYRVYETTRINLYTQGLTKYFGDSYVTARVNLAHTSSRGNAWSGLLKANIALPNATACWGGISYGARLFDIYELAADKQKGYLVSAGISWTLWQRLTLKLGASSGKEDPDFRLRSLLAGLEIKF
jgi:YaiO family outer membrane protein